MIIKKTKEYIPLCFFLPINKTKKTITDNDNSSEYKTRGYSCLDDILSYNFIEQLFNKENERTQYSIYYKRSTRLYYLHGIIKGSSQLYMIPCVETKNKFNINKIDYSKIVILVSTDFITNRKSLYLRFKKLYLSTGINKKNIKIVNANELNLNFCSVYTPTMLDYNEETQKKISGEFLKSIQQGFKDMEELVDNCTITLSNQTIAEEVVSAPF
jgi:hypothetical protein